jgi:hypothetical protein
MSAMSPGNTRRKYQRELARMLLNEPVFNTTARDDEYGRGWNGAVAAMRLVLERVAGKERG